MDDQMLDLTDPGDRLVGRLLQAHAEIDLSPGIAATTRMRTAVMAAAHRRAALIEADATFDAADETTTALAARRAHAARLDEVTHNSWRRPVAAVMAGVLTLGILSGTAFAARPGGPLYEARIWTEKANLPAGAVDRAEAEVHRLDQRIIEAQQASSAGDSSGAQAALVAYARIVVEAAAGTRQNPAARATIEVSVTRHVAVLTQMVASVPEPARDAVAQALVSTTAALDHLEQRPGADPADPADPGAPAAAPVKPTDTAAPAKTDKPAKTERPEKTLKPERTSRPDRTPKPPKAPARTPAGPAGAP